MEDHNKFKDFVDKAIDSDNFKSISDKISNTLISVVDLSRSGLDKLSNKLSRNRTYLPANKNPDLVNQDVKKAKNFKWLRNVSGILTFFMFISFLVCIFEPIFPEDIIVTFLFTLAFLALTFYGHVKYKLALRFYRYREEIGNSRVINVDDFASAVGISKEKCVADLRQLIQKGYFPQARLVKGGNIFLLDRQAYHAYKDYYVNKADEFVEEDKKEELSNSTDLDSLDSYIKKIDDQAAKIKNQSFKDQVLRLKTYLLSLRTKFEKNSLKDLGLEKFIDYYIPTSIKLIDSYINFEKSELEFENVNASMVEIEKSIKTINSAFISVLEDSYTEAIIDVNSEIEVMDTILRQDGLLDEDNIYKKLEGDD
ncbi:MAG: hypothetical protein SPI59_03005 [Finegoldia sp.]|nr:hypothetical protein [Finegoldia sp.]